MRSGEVNSYAELGGPSWGESNAEERFREAVEARIDAQLAKYETSLSACCALWFEIDSMCDDEGHAALKQMVRFLKLDPLAYATYVEYTTGKNTPQVEAVEDKINAADRAARDVKLSLRDAA